MSINLLKKNCKLDVEREKKNMQICAIRHVVEEPSEKRLVSMTWLRRRLTADGPVGSGDTRKEVFLAFYVRQEEGGSKNRAKERNEKDGTCRELLPGGYSLSLSLLFFYNRQDDEALELDANSHSLPRSFLSHCPSGKSYFLPCWL